MMARQVSGFLAEDGTFYESAHGAKRHDAEFLIVDLCVRADINETAILTFIRNNAYAIRDFIDADSFLPEEEQTCTHDRPVQVETQPEEANAGVDRDRRSLASQLLSLGTDQADDDERTEDNAAVQQLPVGGPEPLPDVGSRPRTEAVRNEVKGNGVGSGRSDASSVRRDPVLATRQGSVPPTTRNGSSPSRFRKATVERYEPGGEQEE